MSGLSWLKGKFEEHLLPYIKNAGNKIKDWWTEKAWPTITENLGAIATWWGDNKDSIITNIKDTMISNMSPIIDTTLSIASAAAEVIGSALATIGKKFANWIADYYVSVNKDVAAGDIGLAGSYDDWDNGAWIGFYSPSDLEAKQEIGLLSLMGSVWTYAEIVEFVGEFRCGAFDLNDACAGVTLKVELRLTNPDNAKDIVTVCVTEYTFA